MFYIIQPFLLYIDPGTGSMLFSILIGAAATLFFLGNAAILKLKIIFSSKKGGKAAIDTGYKDYVIYSDHKRYWNVFKPICDEFEKRQNIFLMISYTSVIINTCKCGDLWHYLGIKE